MGQEALNTPSCRLCGEQKAQTIKAPFVFGGSEEHHFWHCPSCDGIYLYPIPSVEDEKRFYLQEFEKFMSSRSKGERDWSGAQAHIATNQDQVTRRMGFLDKHLKEGQKLLEVGCSSGFMLDAFKAKGLACVGVEPSGEFTAFLEEREYEVYESLEALKAQSDQKFDVIVHFFVFEHIRDPRAFLKQIRSLLKPDGVMIAEIPSATDPLTTCYTIPAFERFYWSIAHHYYYTPTSLKFLLDEMGVRYKLIPEQRYDLSNHITWLMDGKPGGQGRFNALFSEKTRESYRQDLLESWNCDTVFLELYND